MLACKQSDIALDSYVIPGLTRNLAAIFPPRGPSAGYGRPSRPFGLRSLTRNSHRGFYKAFQLKASSNVTRNITIETNDTDLTQSNQKTIFVNPSPFGTSAIYSRYDAGVFTTINFAFRALIFFMPFWISGEDAGKWFLPTTNASFC